MADEGWLRPAEVVSPPSEQQQQAPQPPATAADAETKKKDTDSFGPIAVTLDGRGHALRVDPDNLRVHLEVFTESEVEREGSAGGWFVQCCVPGGGSEQLTLARDDVIGAETDGGNGVIVWFAQKSKKSAEKPTRILHKSPKLMCSSKLEATQVCRFIRHWAVWGGYGNQRTLVAIVNPKSGKGRGPKIFRRDVRPLLEGVCGYSVSPYETKCPGHATEIVSTLDLSNCTALVFLGGDGTVHEGLQGLLCRSDWEIVSKLPMVQIPVGSGNGLAASTGVWDVGTGIHTICKGECRPLDITSVVQGSKRSFAFLGLFYGAVSAVDTGTENLRWMGESRFTVGGLVEIAKMRRYDVTFAYRPGTELPPERITKHPSGKQGHQTESLVPGTVSNSVPPTYPVEGEAALAKPLLNSREASSDYQVNDKGDVDSVPLHLFKEKQEQYMIQTLGTGESLGRTPDRMQFPGVPLTGFSDELNKWFAGVVNGTDLAESNAMDGWHVVDVSNLQLLNVLLIPWVAMNSKLAPEAKLGSGTLDVMYCDGGTRSQYLELLLKMDSGKHIDLKIVKKLKASAVLLAPGKRATQIVVDGEVKETMPTYLEIHPRLCVTLLAK